MSHYLTIKEMLCAFLCLTLVSCKQPSNSDLKANLARQDTIGVFTCNDADHGAGRPVTKKYLRNLLNHIASHNSDTFRGDLDASLFCVGSDIDELNAYALAFNRSINFGKNLLLKANHDSEVMAVLAHEIAHVILRHDMGGTQNTADQVGVSERQRVQLQERGKLLSVIRQYKVALATEANGVAHVLACSIRRDRSIATALDSFVDSKTEILSTQIAGHNTILPTPSNVMTFDDAAFAKAKIAAYTDHFIAQHRAYSAQTGTIENPSVDADDNNEFKDLLLRLDSVGCRDNSLNQLRSESLAFENEIAKISARIEAITSQMSVLNTNAMSTEKAENWKESEADDIGFNLYSSTDLSSYGFTWIYALTGAKKANISAGELNDRQLIDQMNAHCVIQENVVRGTRSHPATCWRILNILRTQRNKAMAEGRFGKLPFDTVISSDPSLDQVKYELRATQ